MLERQRFFIKEQVTFRKTTDTYDIFDPDTQERVGVAVENPGTFITSARSFISKRLLPTKVEVRELPDESLVFTVRRPLSFWRTRLDVYDAEDELIGYFKSKRFSLGGGFWVYDKDDNPFAEVKGNWVDWDFTFRTPDGRELGVISKKWAGLAKELFSSADDYVVAIDDSLAGQPIAKMLLLAAGLAIDMVFQKYEG